MSRSKAGLIALVLITPIIFVAPVVVTMTWSPVIFVFPLIAMIWTLSFETPLETSINFFTVLFEALTRTLGFATLFHDRHLEFFALFKASVIDPVFVLIIPVAMVWSTFFVFVPIAVVWTVMVWTMMVIAIFRTLREELLKVARRLDELEVFDIKRLGASRHAAHREVARKRVFIRSAIVAPQGPSQPCSVT